MSTPRKRNINFINSRIKYMVVAIFIAIIAVAGVSYFTEPSINEEKQLDWCFKLDMTELASEVDYVVYEDGELMMNFTAFLRNKTTSDPVIVGNKPAEVLTDTYYNFTRPSQFIPSMIINTFDGREQSNCELTPNRRILIITFYEPTDASYRYEIDMELGYLVKMTMFNSFQIDDYDFNRIDVFADRIILDGMGIDF